MPAQSSYSYSSYGIQITSSHPLVSKGIDTFHLFSWMQIHIISSKKLHYYLKNVQIWQPFLWKTWERILELKENHYICNVNRLLMRRIEVIDRIKAEVRKMRPQVQTILYGSEARGEARPDSDIDLLMLVDVDKLTYEDKDRIIAPLYDIELDTGIIISTLIMPRKEWENRPFQTPFQYNVSKEGITLWTPDWLQRITQHYRNTGKTRTWDIGRNPISARPRIL